jgi:hypothetical protein
MQQNYDLKELLRNPNAPLTKEQYCNFDKYMTFANDDKAACNVDISAVVNERISEIEKTGVYWR